MLIAGVGYIGAPLARAYLSRGESVVGLDNFFCTSAAALAELRQQPAFQFIRGSISSERTLQRVFNLGPFETIHLLAAQPSASPVAASAAYTERTNLVGARMLLDFAHRGGSSRVVFGSSFHVYGTPLIGHVDEQRPYGAFSDLSHLSKVYVEKLIEMYTRIHPISGVSVRLGIVYGLGPIMKTNPLFMTVPNRFSYQAARGESLQVNPQATAPIGFLHLRDAVTALLAASSLPERYASANAAGESLSVREVAIAVRDASRLRGIAVAVNPEPAQPAIPAQSSFTVSSRLEQLGWRPGVHLRDSVGEIIDHARASTETGS
ncbi:MAG: NAD-dependent epimerase/dehydratase family protein [Chloroflexota bacterium]